MQLHTRNPHMQSLLEQLISFGFSRKRLRESADPTLVSVVEMHDPLSGFFIEVDFACNAVKAGREKVADPMVVMFTNDNAKVVVSAMLREVASAIYSAQQTVPLTDHQTTVLQSDYEFGNN